LEEKTSEEVFMGKKPSVDHLRIFGSHIYIHVPKENKTKLEPYGKKGTFVGYNETSKSYRIYVPRKTYIEVSRDVKFYEEAAFCHSREIPCDIEEKDTRTSEPSYSQISDEQREEAREPSMDPIRVSIEFLPEKHLVKRKPTWCRKILKEAEKHATPKSTSEKARSQISTHV
jgi:hypothetical protein